MCGLTFGREVEGRETQTDLDVDIGREKHAPSPVSSIMIWEASAIRVASEKQFLLSILGWVEGDVCR